MKHRRVGERVLVRLDRGEEIIEALAELCAAERLTAATVRGIGAVSDATIGYYDLSTRTYLTRGVPEICELLSLMGNVALVEGGGEERAPFVHAHVTLGTRNFEVLGGHLVKATVAVTAELVLDRLETSVVRRLDEEVSLKLWDL